jgi:enterochelin esterase-like enzyme
MDSATYDALGLSTPFEDKTGGKGRNPSGSGFLNINDGSELSPERAAVRNGPSDAEYAEEQRMYPLPPEATVEPSVPTGEIKEYMGWAQSTVFPDTERDFWVYVSASYSDENDRSSSLLVVQDGKSYLKPDGLVRTTTILDNMVASGALPPTVAVFLEPGRRLHPPIGDPSVGADGAGDIVDDAQRSLESDTVSERYGRFLLEDILPFIRQFVPNITTDPRRRALMGVSSGCAIRHCFVLIQHLGCFLMIIHLVWCSH